VITHKGITWPRRMPGGYLRPYVVDLMRGREELARLQAAGLDLDLDQLLDLNIAVLGASLPRPPAPEVEDTGETLDQILDRITAERDRRPSMGQVQTRVEG
jgi:hypothetical protein